MSPNNVTKNNEMLVLLRGEENIDAAPITKLEGGYVWVIAFVLVKLREHSIRAIYHIGQRKYLQ